MRDNMTLDEFLTDLPQLALEKRDELRGHDNLFLVETRQGRRAYIRIRDGLITVEDSAEGTPVCRLMADEGLIMQLIRGEIHPAKALVTGKVRIHGDVKPLLRLIRCLA